MIDETHSASARARVSPGSISTKDFEGAQESREIAIGQPVFEQVATDGDASRRSGRVLEAVFERPPEVGPLGPESREGINLTVIVGAGDGGEVRDPCQVATPKKHLGIAGEPLPAELAQDLEHAEPLAPGSLHALDE